jgi:HlyD family secretion protein
MMKKKLIALGILVLIGIGTTLFFYLSPKKGEGPLILYGNVDIREVDLGFRVFGKVKGVYFEEGDSVKKGDLLAELDAVPYEEQLLESKAQQVSARLAYENAEKQFMRRKEAIKSSAVSEEDFANAESSMKEAGASLEAALASLAKAETSYEDTRLVSPSNGVLLTRIREPGSILNPGQPVFSLALYEPIWVRAYVSEPDLGKIYPGMRAQVFTDSSATYEGQIGFISPVAEFTPKNVETTDLRTELVYRIRVVIAKPDEWLRQGMPVTVQLNPDR